MLGTGKPQVFVPSFECVSTAAVTTLLDLRHLARRQQPRRAVRTCPAGPWRLQLARRLLRPVDRLRGGGCERRRDRRLRRVGQARAWSTRGDHGAPVVAQRRRLGLPEPQPGLRLHRLRAQPAVLPRGPADRRADRAGRDRRPAGQRHAAIRPERPPARYRFQEFSSDKGTAHLPQTYEKAWDVNDGACCQRSRGLRTAFRSSTLRWWPASPRRDSRRVIEANDSGWIHAYEPRGGEAPGFPKFTGQWPSFSGVIAGAGPGGAAAARVRHSRGVAVHLEGRRFREARLVAALSPRRAQQRPAWRRLGRYFPVFTDR